jgi:hypothetical protein
MVYLASSTPGWDDVSGPSGPLCGVGRAGHLRSVRPRASRQSCRNAFDPVDPAVTLRSRFAIAVSAGFRRTRHLVWLSHTSFAVDAD